MPATTRHVTLVQEVMTRNPICVERDTTLRQFARLLEELEVSGAPVIDDDRRVVGVVSKTDLIRRCMEETGDEAPGYFFEMLAEEAGEDVEFHPERQATVEEFMSTDLVTAAPDERLSTVARRLAEGRVHRAVVIDGEGRALGIITSLDILGAFPS